MRKSERLRQLELAVVKMEMHMELLALSLSNLLDSQGMDATPSLDSGKWYKRPTDTP